MPDTAKAGTYIMTINSSGSTSVFISGSTTICFEHGFSLDKPIFINETSKQPIVGKVNLILLTNSIFYIILDN